MRGMLSVVLFIALTVVCWGTYGPMLHHGQMEMGNSRWLPFICVGLAYFVIAVIVPIIYLMAKGEVGHWSTKGTVLSLISGAAGALGSLGIILAFTYGGRPIFVMPLVFGCAPVINTFVTMAMARTYRAAGPVFFAGLILVVTGAVTVLYFKPTPPKPEVQQVAESTEAGPAAEAPVEEAPKKGPVQAATDALLVYLSVGLTALSWGIYGPVLHMGQMAMAGSRMRPFICVGLAYFALAVILPVVALTAIPDFDQGSWTFIGTSWSFIAGIVTSVGALGIIMAFNFGGKPIYVMPLVFGGAPVVNTFTTIGASVYAGHALHPSPLFYAGLILVAVGAVTVLVFSPKPSKGHAPSATKTEPSAEPATSGS